MTQHDWLIAVGSFIAGVSLTATAFIVVGSIREELRNRAWRKKNRRAVAAKPEFDHVKVSAGKEWGGGDYPRYLEAGSHKIDMAEFTVRRTIFGRNEDD